MGRSGLSGRFSGKIPVPAFEGSGFIITLTGRVHTENTGGRNTLHDPV
jgi:hypothetical protein